MRIRKMTLAAEDFERMKAFYDAVFDAGLQPIREGMASGAFAGIPLLLCSNVFAGVDARQNRQQFDVEVRDLEAVCQAAETHGGVVRERNSDHATLVDPDGNTVVVHASPGSAIERHGSASPYEPIVGYCRVVRAGSRVTVGGTAPIGPNGENVEGDAEVQAARCLTVISDALRKVGATPAHVVRTRVFLTDAADWKAVGRAHAAMFGANPPVATFVVVAALLDPAWKVEIEADAEIV